MVATEGDEAGQGAAELGHAGLGGGGEGRAGEEGVVAFFDLLEGIGVIVRGYGDVAAVDDFAPEVEGVGVHGAEESVSVDRGPGACVTYTLYPPLNPSFREPLNKTCMSRWILQWDVLKIEASRTLTNPAGTEASSGAVGCARIKWCTCQLSVLSAIVYLMAPTDEGNVIFLLIAGKAREVRQTAEGRDARKD